MNRFSYILIPFMVIALLMGCWQRQEPFTIQKKSMPFNRTGAQPFLSTDEDGNVLLSWIEYLDPSRDALLLSHYENGQWKTPDTVASGTDWFVNWADFPSVRRLNDGSLAAYWLKKSSPGTYDYDIHLSFSKDNGSNWTESIIPHNDSINTEHGFVSVLPLEEDIMFMSWLDGRNMEGNHEHGHKMGGGAMSLRGAIIRSDGLVLWREELDPRVCDCCQTSTTLWKNQIIVAYRDRDKDETRDISLVAVPYDPTRGPGQISRYRVHKDNWQIAGCPVNGPSVTSTSQALGISWFTMHGDTGVVNFKILSHLDYPDRQELLQLNEAPALGRVATVPVGITTFATTWLEQDGEKTSLKIGLVDKDRGVLSKEKITSLPGSRSNGFPVMASKSDSLIVAWTEGEEETVVTFATLPISLFK